MNYLSVGNIACDVLATASPQQKKSMRRIYLQSLICCLGGDALNSAVDAAAMGQHARLIGCVGQDLFGREILERLRQTGVDCSMLRIDARVPTSVSHYMVEPDGEKSGALYRPGGNEALCEADVPDEALAWADHLHLGSPMIQDSLDGGGNAVLLRRAKQFGVTTSMDLVYDQDEIWLPKIEEALHWCDIFIPSDYEVSKVCKTENLQDIKAFFRPYGLKVFGVKLGKRGVFLTDFQQDFLIPSAYTGMPTETLGAGDAFFAAFNVAWHNGEGLYRSAVIGSCASACVLGNYGASTGMTDYAQLTAMADQFEKRLSEANNEVF